MTERERLIEILDQEPSRYSDDIADHLLKNGVIVPPCKVGDTVYVNTTCNNIRMYKDNDYFGGTGEETCPYEDCCEALYCWTSNKVSTFETTVKQILIDDTGVHIFVEDFNLDITIGDFGGTVFLTNEEAEKALKERERK